MNEFLRKSMLAAAIALAAQFGAGNAIAQETANSAAFWLQEHARSEQHLRPAQHQPMRVRRLVPNRKLARPTIWQAPAGARDAPAPDGAAPSAPGTTPPTEAVMPPAETATSPAAIAPPTEATATPGAEPTSPQPASAPQNADAVAAPPIVSAPASSISIAVVGDNVGYWLAQGLADAAAEGPAEGGARMVVVRKTRDSSGLVRDDFYDWQKNLREILSGPEKFGAAVILIGSNDLQELRDSAGRYESLTPRWRVLYAARVDAFIAQFKERNIPFFWVGLPIMRSEHYASEIGELNEIYRAHTEAAGGKFVDAWDAFADEGGRYSVFGPDVNGQIVKLRTGDGIHFTKAGARKLAYFAEQAMRPLLEIRKPQPEAAIAALAPASVGPAGPTLPPSLAAPAAAPRLALPAPPPPKPLAGPILPLTAPPIAPGGGLAGSSDAARRSEEARATIAPDLALGRETPAPAGRADDFAWPPR